MRRKKRTNLIEGLESRVLLSSGTPVNVTLTSDPGAQQAPSVAVDPADANHLVVAYMDYSLVHTGYAGIGVNVSRDGGTHWQGSSLALPAGFDQGAANPLVRFGTGGEVYLTFMSVTYLGSERPGINDPVGVVKAHGFESNNGVFVARSDDGGTTWNSPVAIASHVYASGHPVLFDINPDLAVDRARTLPGGTANPAYGTLYATFTRFFPPGTFPGEPRSTGGSQIMLAASTDEGRTWDLRLGTFDDKPGVPTTVVRDATHNTGIGPPAGLGAATNPHIAVGAAGDVYVSFYDFGLFDVVRSTDGGRTFDVPDLKTGAHILFDQFDSANANEALGPTNDGVRSKPPRAIAADPSKPDRVYVVEGIEKTDSSGSTLDYGDIYFSRSLDGGQNWVNGFYNRPKILNDDNGGRVPSHAAGEVDAAQGLCALTVGPNGDLVAVWLDTRRDPAGHTLDVFGTVSRDGGRRFSPNFRVTDGSFDADRGQYTDANGKPSVYLGNFISVAASSQYAYVVWTDTRNGNQDVEFARIALADPPAAADDRFEPNNRFKTATDLGQVVRKTFPGLRSTPGNVDLYRVTCTASGPLVVTVSGRGLGDMGVEILDAVTGAVISHSAPVLAPSGRVYGQRAEAAARTGEKFVIRVSPGAQAADYTLALKSLTGELGTVAHATQTGNLNANDQDFYLLSAAADGMLNVTLTGRKGLTGTPHLDLVDPQTLGVIGAGAPGNGGATAASAAVTKGQEVLVRVTADGATQGRFRLSIDDVDQYSVAAPTALTFPAGAGPSVVKTGDLNGDHIADLVVTDGLSDVVSVLLGNGDGTFQAPRQFAVGAFVAGNETKLHPLNLFRRDVAIADFNRDGAADLVVANPDSGDVSVLLNRGDGTFLPQRRFDATSSPFAVDVGDVNGDGRLDVVTIDDVPATKIKVAVLLGRGDGTFARERLIVTAASKPFEVSEVRLADLNRDGHLDLLLTGGTDESTHVMLGDGTGAFVERKRTAFKGAGPAMALADLNGDGATDVVHANLYNDNISYDLGNGDGTFPKLADDERHLIFGGPAPVDVVLADVASEIDNPDGSRTMGPPDGHLDVVVAANGFSLTAFPNGPAGIYVLPGLVDGVGKFAGFGENFMLAGARSPQSVTTDDFDRDGSTDVAYVDDTGVHVRYGKPPQIVANTTAAKARNLGTVVHLLEPTLTLTPGRTDAYFTFDVPTEAAPGAGNEVIDVDAHFAQAGGAGLKLDVTDQSGKVLGSGEHFRVVARQGARLGLHVSGVAGTDGAPGTGSYTLDLTALPQLVSAEAQYVPVGDGSSVAATSIVLTFQGDRIDQSAAEDARNYAVIWLGEDGRQGGGDDQTVSPARVVGVKPAIYDPGSNVEVASGTTYPKAVKQTVTLVFDRPLPAGSYAIGVSDRLVAAAFNADEASLVTAGAHSLVGRVGGKILAGAKVVAPELVKTSDDRATVGAFAGGTPLLTQLHGDVGALLDQQLSSVGDDPRLGQVAAVGAPAPQLTQSLLNQINARLAPGVAQGKGAAAFLVLFLDPVSFDLVDPQSERLSYSLQTGRVAGSIPNTFVSVAGNVELVVVPLTSDGRYVLQVNDIPEAARGGAVVLGTQTDGQTSFTEDLRQAGATGARFEVDVKLRDAQATTSDVVATPVRRAVVALAAVAGAGLVEVTNSVASPRVAAGRPVEARPPAREAEIRTPIGDKPEEGPVISDPLGLVERALEYLGSVLRSIGVKGARAIAPAGKGGARGQVERKARASLPEIDGARGESTTLAAPRAEVLWKRDAVAVDEEVTAPAEAGAKHALARRSWVGRGSLVVSLMLATAWVGLQGGANRRLWSERQIEEEVDDE